MNKNSKKNIYIALSIIGIISLIGIVFVWIILASQTPMPINKI